MRITLTVVDTLRILGLTQEPEPIDLSEVDEKKPTQPTIDLNEVDERKPPEPTVDLNEVDEKNPTELTIDLSEVDDKKPIEELTSIATTSHESDDFWSSFDSSATTSDPMDQDSAQYVQTGYEKREFGDIALASFNPWEFTSVMQNNSGYQRLSGYHEGSYERTNSSTNPYEARLQETENDMNRAAVEIVDLTMLD